MGEPWCVALTTVRRGDVARVGGKAANLGELLHAGFPVPRGFVITTAAYRAVIAAHPTVSRADGPTIPQEIADDIRRALRGLGEGPVAVRSSATAEDLPGATFAGQQDTFLNVTGVADVLVAVRDCWSSLFSERALAYRSRLHIEPSSVAMGVVVQAMVPAEAAGVMFTADPVTGARDTIVIDAGHGLGEAVVSGAVTPEHFVVDGRNEIRHRAPVSPTTAGAPVLGERQVVELAAIGRRIARHFGAPQDIEWATYEGRLHILQSRSMTALPPAPIRLNRFQRFIGPTLVELLPRRPYPMELTAWIRPTVAAHVTEMMGALTGMRVDFDAMMPARDGVVQEFVPPSPRPSPPTPVRILHTVVRGVRLHAGGWRADPLALAYRRGTADLTHLDPRLMTPQQLAAVPLRAAALASLMTRLRVKYIASGLVGIIGLRLALTGRSAQFAQIIGTVPTQTRAANTELEELAETAAQIPMLGEWLAHGNLQDRALASALPAATQWWARFERFLTTYGHRETASAMLVHDPFWIDSPSTVLGLVRVLMDGTVPDQRPGRASMVHLRWGPAQRLARAAGEGVAFREDTHFELTRTGPAVRGAINEVGRRLEAAGLLDDNEDVWMLTLDEITAWVAGSRTAPSVLRESAARRGAAWGELASTPLIATTTLYPRRAGSGTAAVVGAAGGGGRATGPVRIIHDTSEFSELRAGEVLVCATTNPSWTPLFQRAAAVVVDHGGMASHAAIVAREYGIPAVMGAGTATRVLQDGQVVTVDGDLGEVNVAT